MAIIYTYPTVTPSLTDKVLISGVNNKTQNATLNSIKDVLDVVDTFSSTFGTFISGTNNTSATGNVSVGTIDLSATGTPSSTKFLKGNNTWDSVSLTTDVSGILPIANGGTNASTASAAITNLLPSQAGQAGNFLKTDGTTATWASAAGGGTITGSGTANQVAYFSGNSAIAGQDNLTLTNSGILKSGSFSDDIAGSIYIENETGNVGGTLRLYGKENDTGASKYIVLNASQSASATAYNLYFPPTVASAAGKVLKSVGANGELEWGDDNSGTIGGTVSASDIPVGTAANTLGDSIMSQHVATSNPTHNRIRITSPSVNPNLGQFPSLQLYNGSNGSWSTGAVLSEIQTYSADASTPSNPHVCSFINTVRGEPLSGAAVDGELVFGTAPYNEPVGAQESMRIDRDGSILVKQVGISTDDNYRTGNVSVQNTGEFRLYGSSPFTSSNYHSIKNNNGALEIGDQAGFSGSINFFVDQASALEINDSAESTFKQSVTVSAGDLTVSSGDIIAGSNGDFKTSGNGHFFSGDGTQIRPAFTFDSDNDTGLYLASAGLMRFSSSGINVASIDGTGVEVFNNLKIKGNRNNSSNVQTTNGIIELSNNSTSAFGFQSNIDSNSQTTGANRHIIFRYNGTEVGYIRNATSNSVVFATNASDERKKKNIVNWDEKVLEDFSSIEPKKFNYLNEEDSDGLTKGFIAQQMVDKFPEAYPKDADTENETGYYSFNPSGMTVYLMKAVKELKEEIDALNNRIKVLES